MKIGIAAVGSLLVIVGCSWGNAAAARDPAPRDELTYSTQPYGKVFYKVRVEIGQGADSEIYEGTLRYEQHDVAGNWEAEGELNVSRWRPPADGLMGGIRQPLLDPPRGATARFRMDKFGKASSISREHPLKFLLGDFTQWAIWPLPQAGQTTWQVSEPVLVQQIERDKRLADAPFVQPSSFFDDERLSAAVQTSSYKITGSEGPHTLIEETYELKANNTNPPLTLSGSGTGRFDRKRGVFEHLQWSRQIVVTREGAEIRVPVKVTLQRDMDFGLLPLTDAQKASIKKATEEAKRQAESPEAVAAAAAARQQAEAMAADTEQRRAEAKAQSDAEERKQWIAALNAATDHAEISHIWVQLLGQTPRPDAELARALVGLGNRMGGNSSATRYFDMAANFHPPFAEVLPLRNAYTNSSAPLPEVGAPIPRSVTLSKGQLLAVKEKKGDRFFAKLVDSQSSGSVSVVSLSGSAPEVVPYSRLRAPAPAIVPYLPVQQRLVAAGTPPPQAGPLTSRSALVPSQTRVWMDSTGRFSMTGRFLSLKDDVVRLEKSDGTVLDVPISRLRDADAQLARELATAAD